MRNLNSIIEKDNEFILLESSKIVGFIDENFEEATKFIHKLKRKIFTETEACPNYLVPTTCSVAQIPIVNALKTIENKGVTKIFITKNSVYLGVVHIYDLIKERII